ncbi:hypothetical protein EC847_102361 [Scandinavium goeteborgense]|uniref:Uncharacterized protein n=1 Tax=Scandinavium goeteborgense TaxID=1851514 RepID=A0A4R6ENI9_SCAGO|nr:hypothetical protein EC847_102361 [Scandinavium goeteborgense]
MPEISTGHHNPITPQDRDTRSTCDNDSCVGIGGGSLPLLTTALFTPERHCDDFLL